jgi:hypothetical protein
MPLKHTSSAAFRPDGVAERFTTSPGSSPESGAGYMHENHDVCTRWLQDSNSNSAELTERESRQQSMLRDGRPGPDSAARCNFVLDPRSHFRPIPGLVSLFARTGTSRTGPRATLFRKPHIPSRKPISYADVLRAADMDGGRSSQGGAGGRGAGPGGSRTGLGAGPGRAGADLENGWVTQGGARSRGAGLGGRGFRHGQGAVPGRAGFQQAHRQGFEARRGSFNQFDRGMNHFSNSRVVRGSSAFRGRGAGVFNRFGGQEPRCGQRAGSQVNFSRAEAASSSAAVPPSAEALAQAVALINQAFSKQTPSVSGVSLPAVVQQVFDSGDKLVGDARGENVLPGKNSEQEDVVVRGAAQGKTKDGKPPYCWRCLTKGHVMVM